MGSAGHELVESCSSESFSGDDIERVLPKVDLGDRRGYDFVRKVLVTTGHISK